MPALNHAIYRTTSTIILFSFLKSLLTVYTNYPNKIKSLGCKPNKCTINKLVFEDHKIFE